MHGRAPLAIGDLRWWAGPEIDEARLRALVRAMDAALAAGARDQKGGRRKESFLLALEGSAPDYLLKVNHYGSLPFWRRWRQSKARAELERAERLAALGIPTPIPVAAGELRRVGLLDRCYGLVRFLPDATDLLRLWHEGRGDVALEQAWTRELGALVRRMHDAGVHQEDLAPNNFLWRSTAEPCLLAIDFERTRVGRRVAARDRAFALAKLDRHFSGATAASRMRFLRAYAAGDRAEARRWGREVTALLPALARRDLRHWMRAGTRPGRRFDALAIEADGVAWRGFQRRDAPLEGVRAGLVPGCGVASWAIAGTCVVRRFAAPGARDAVRAWGLAQVLHQRRLSPEPVAMLRSAGAAMIAFLRTDDLLPLEAAPASERRAALVVAIDRLLGFGLDVSRLRPAAFAFAPTRRNVMLLDPSLVDFRGAPEAARRAFARAWTERQLG